MSPFGCIVLSRCHINKTNELVIVWSDMLKAALAADISNQRAMAHCIMIGVGIL